MAGERRRRRGPIGGCSNARPGPSRRRRHKGCLRRGRRMASPAHRWPAPPRSSPAVARQPLRAVPASVSPALHVWFSWSDSGSIRGPHAFQACALPTELSDRGAWFCSPTHDKAVDATRPPQTGVELADPTGFEPATSGLTGRRALLAAPRVQTVEGKNLSDASSATNRVGARSPSGNHRFTVGAADVESPNRFAEAPEACFG